MKLWEAMDACVKLRGKGVNSLGRIAAGLPYWAIPKDCTDKTHWTSFSTGANLVAAFSIERMRIIAENDDWVVVK